MNGLAGEPLGGTGGPDIRPMNNFNRNRTDPTTAALWRERERRQQTIRLFLMVLMMLVLMDSDHDQQQQHQNQQPHQHNSNTNFNPHHPEYQYSSSKRLRQAASTGSAATASSVASNSKYYSHNILSPSVWDARRRQDARIRQIVQTHERYRTLVDRNHQNDTEQHILRWWAVQREQEMLEAAASNNNSTNNNTTTAMLVKETEGNSNNDSYDLQTKVFHYPCNLSGFYRGDWAMAPSPNVTTKSSKTKLHSETRNATDLEDVCVQELLFANSSRTLGVMLLPENFTLVTRDDHNLTSLDWDRLTVDKSGGLYKPNAPTGTDDDVEDDDESHNDDDVDESDHHRVYLTRQSGKMALQLYSHSIPAVDELSLVDGFVKLDDSPTPGYSSRKDIFVRVRGVIIHAIGEVSLVANADVRRSALIVPDPEGTKTSTTERKSRFRKSLRASEISDTQRRRLQEAVDQKGVSTIRESAWNVYGSAARQSNDWKPLTPADDSIPYPRRLSEQQPAPVATDTNYNETTATRLLPDNETDFVNPIPWSDVVIPYPFVHDDADETIRRVKTSAARRLNPSQQRLENSLAHCEFSLNLQVSPMSWSIGEWRALWSQRLSQTFRLDPASTEQSVLEQPDASSVHGGPPVGPTATSRKIHQPEALAMHLVGTMSSVNCNFHATINATAVRTDWDATTSKVINYSFYMMLVCLSQILLLLRQLLHSQGFSAATRVSMLSIGWQAVIDALICLAHIYCSLAMQSLFTAFASVAFFKLLIFCVIEMKYMAIVIQARNSSNGGQTAEMLRRQVAMLHLRFYIGLCAAFVLLLYMNNDSYRMLYVLTLYSFWVPQIILNIVTEAKNPLHKYYINGMSISRLVAPLYILGVKQNFLKELSPESPTDIATCQALIVWVALQAAILHAQSKYGTRFMIPARFLPPKFDYSRPIPASMLPAGVDSLPDLTDYSESSDMEQEGPRSERRRNRESGARKRGARRTRSASPPTCTLDCSICYDSIDLRDRANYMLAPCNHLFHRECLVQWMDVKMECPICRTALPAL